MNLSDNHGQYGASKENHVCLSVCVGGVKFQNASLALSVFNNASVGTQLKLLLVILTEWHLIFLNIPFKTSSSY